jgi:hypothetical protein
VPLLPLLTRLVKYDYEIGKFSYQSMADSAIYPIFLLKICHVTKHMLEEDSTHVMIKVMLQIICLRNHNSKITGANVMSSSMLRYVPGYEM